MARFDRRDNRTYYEKTRQQREDQENKVLNLALRGQERIERRYKDWQILESKDIEQRREDPGVRYKVQTAATINPDRPRAMKIAYSAEAQKLVIKFRGSKGNENNGPWIEYAGIPIEMWNDLRATDSTGRYLKYSGLDAHPWSNFDPSEMPPEVRVLFNS
jgi:hypothetical protein